MKKYFLLTCCLFLFLLTNLSAQVFDGNIILTSQVEIDAFNYTVVNGTLRIEEAVQGNITNLNGLSELTFVKVLSIINNYALNNVDGLNELTRIDNGLLVQNNNLLTNFNGFSSLDVIANVVIQDNPSLTNISGLSGVIDIFDAIDIINNDALTNIDGLSNILDIGDRLRISNNESLINIDGLTNLTRVGEELNIIANPSLTTIKLSNLIRVDENFRIENNTSLIEIDLSSLNSVLDDFTIKNNQSLTNIKLTSFTIKTHDEFTIADNATLPNLDGLSNLTSVKEFKILNNDALTDIDGLSNLTTITQFEIAGNAALSNIDGLSNLTTAGILVIGNNAVLSNIDGLSNLTTAGNIEIGGNAVLSNIDGLSNLTELSELYIVNNNALNNINGLFNLTTISRHFEIRNNIALTNIDGLSNLNSVGTNPITNESFKISDNTALIRFCGLYTLFSTNGFTGSYEISGNAFNPTGLEIIDDGPCPPSANAGDDQTVIAGETVQLDGSGSSDPGNDPLTYSWSFTSKPSGSNASLSDNNVVDPTFVTDIPGNYVLQLIVNNGLNDSDPDDVTITALSIPQALMNSINDVQALPLNNGNKNSLISKLTNAIKKYNQGNLNAAKNELTAFINQLNSLIVEELITQAEAEPLIEYVNRVIAVINSSLPKADNDNTLTPEEFALHQNFPNPFNPSTVISYQLPVGSHVSLKVFDILGNEIATLVNEELSPGIYEVEFDEKNLSSGMYIYRLTAGGFISTRKMLMIK